jgi:hypothetical protein
MTSSLNAFKHPCIPITTAISGIIIQFRKSNLLSSNESMEARKRYIRQTSWQENDHGAKAFIARHPQKLGLG